MKVTCDNCGAVYRIPEAKLTKEVSRATCKKCGNKIVIHKPSASLSDGGLGSSYAFEDDDDAIVNHEERTVIATVPELQRFDATPPLSVPGSSPDHLDDEVEPEHTLDDSPAAPAAAARSAAPPAASAGPEAATPRLSGVPIPSQFRVEVGSAPLAMVAIGILGTLLFIRDLNGWVWSNSTSTAVGFALALYAQVAVLMALLDLRAQRSPRPQMVFGVPAAVCVLVFLLLLVFQGKDKMAFLNHGGVEVAVLDDTVTDSMDGIIYEEVMVENPETGKMEKVRRPRRNRNNLPASSGGTVPGLQTGTGQAVASVGPAGGVDPAELGTGLRPGGPRPGPGGLVAKSLHEDKLDKSRVQSIVLNDDGMTRCVRIHSAGINGALIYEVTLFPSGKVRSANFDKKSAYHLSEFEKCMNDRVERLEFPSFTGDDPETVEVKFLL